MTSREKKGRCHRKRGNASKFSVGDTVGVSSRNLKSIVMVNILCKNSNYHVRSITLWN